MLDRIVIPTNIPGVLLRQLVPEDAKKLFKLVSRNREYLTKAGALDGHYDDLKSALKSITHTLDLERLYLGIWVASELIGSLHLTPFRHSDFLRIIEIGYWVSEKHSGKGIATSAAIAATDYALTFLGEKTVRGIVHQDNIGSRKVLQKAGYRVGLTTGDLSVLYKFA